MVRAARHLRQVGHAEDLAIGGKALHEFADDGSHRAADAGIGFVEDQRRDRIRLGGEHGDGQAEP